MPIVPTPKVKKLATTAAIERIIVKIRDHKPLSCTVYTYVSYPIPTLP